MNSMQLPLQVYLSLEGINTLIAPYPLQKMLRQLDYWSLDILDLPDNSESVPYPERITRTDQYRQRVTWHRPFRYGFNQFGTGLFHDTNQVTYMTQVNEYMYYETTRYQLVELEYSRGDHCLGLIVPKGFRDELYPVTVNNQPIMTCPLLEELINNLSYQVVDVTLPKFTSTATYQLHHVLEMLDCTTDLESYPVQSNTIIIDETGPIVVCDRPATVTVRADHVFLFYLRHRPSGAIILYGDYQG